MTRTRLLALPLATAVLGLGLTACGGGSDSDYLDAAVDAKPATGPTLKSDGFELHVPSGWKDATSQFKQQQTKVTVGAIAPTVSENFRANVNVIAQDDIYTGDKVSSSDLGKGEKAIPSTLKRAGATYVHKQPRLSLDGADMLHFSTDATVQDVKYHTEQYYAFHGGSEYTITFSFPPSSSETQREDVVRPVFASWSWTD